MARHRAEPTTSQGRHPWRAALRSVLEFVVAFAAAAPLLYEAVMQQDAAQAGGGVAVGLGVMAAITRLMASPATERLLTRFAPWLLPEPPEREPEPEPGA